MLFHYNQIVQHLVLDKYSPLLEILRFLETECITSHNREFATNYHLISLEVVIC